MVVGPIDEEGAAMAERWEDAEELLVATAGDDLEVTDEVTPAVVAFRGDVLLFVSWLPPFPRGEHHAPVLEICSLAAVLGADRLAMSFGARVWSLDDPIPPVSADGDLRQRAVAVHLVDAVAEPSRSMHALHPFDMVDGRPVWGVRLAHPDVQGWIPATLTGVAESAPGAARPGREVRLRLRRLTERGHDVHVGPALGRRLDAVCDPRYRGR